jgi:hypothetical protein
LKIEICLVFGICVFEVSIPVMEYRFSSYRGELKEDGHGQGEKHLYIWVGTRVWKIGRPAWIDGTPLRTCAKTWLFSAPRP